MSTRGELAEDLFRSGYNCSQAIVMAFDDMLPIDRQNAAKLASPFGGGMGGLREVCGAFSGMLIVLGFVEGSADPSGKREIYNKTQELAAKFKEANGSLVCGEMLGLRPTPDGTKIQKKPCPVTVRVAADILDEYLRGK